MIHRKMKKLLTLLFLLTILVCLLFEIKPARAESVTWIVDDDGPADFSSIQSAIDSPLVLDGDTVFVRNGTYYENVVVDKSLSFVGESKEATFVNGGDEDRTSAFIVLKDNTRISNFNIWIGESVMDYGRYCINLQSSNNIVSSNNLRGWAVGIGTSAGSSSNNAIYMNDIRCYNGMFIYSGNTIFWNKLFSGLECILIRGSGNLIYENTITGNLWGMYVTSGDNKIYHNNFIENNIQVETYSTGVWDDGYPSGGNYWSDHVTVDDYSGINQDEPGSDGIVDEPYIIDDYNRDNYPLAEPWVQVLVAEGKACMWVGCVGKVYGSAELHYIPEPDTQGYITVTVFQDDMEYVRRFEIVKIFKKDWLIGLECNSLDKPYERMWVNIDLKAEEVITMGALTRFVGELVQVPFNG